MWGNFEKLPSKVQIHYPLSSKWRIDYGPIGKRCRGYVITYRYK